MALYALDEDRLVYAADAQENKLYQCRGCRSAVRVRRGPFRVPHFYHRTRAPSCRLYSKSEDHLLAQLAIQALLPPGEAQIEAPILDIARIADVLWIPQRISFEIQCSLLTPYEVERRVADYASSGYRIVWILDDRIFNRRRLRPAESLIRQSTSYYATLRKTATPVFYDQFELLTETQRLKKGRPLKVDLKEPQRLRSIQWASDDFPIQVLAKANIDALYFKGDLLHKALLSYSIPALFFAMQNFRALEILYKDQRSSKNSLFMTYLTKYLYEPFGRFMLFLMEWAENNY